MKDKDYVIEQPNQCRLKLNIPLSMVNDINQELKKDHEISGVIYCNDDNQIISVNKTKGDADSVYTPNNVINFHTHPSSAYNNGKTVWGWPSGEDIRETIKFGLAGNKAHLVFSVEGLYTIQISPCKIKKMRELLNDQERGVLIFAIEEYFKTTHNFRGIDEVNKLSHNDVSINPYSYVDFVNTFDLVNLLKNQDYKKIILQETENIGHTGIHGTNNINHYSFGNSRFVKIPNVGFPDINGNKISTKSLKNYIRQQDLKDLRKIDEKGQEESFRVNSIDKILEILHNIFEKFNVQNCNIKWNSTNNNGWFFVNFFPSNNYREGDYLRNKVYVTPNIKVDVTTDIEPFIRIFSNKKEGCTVNQIGQSNRFKIGKMTKMGHCKNCGFGSKPSKQRFVGKRIKQIPLRQLLRDLKILEQFNNFGGCVYSCSRSTTRRINPEPDYIRQLNLEHNIRLEELLRQNDELNREHEQLNRENEQLNREILLRQYREKVYNSRKRIIGKHLNQKPKRTI